MASRKDTIVGYRFSNPGLLREALTHPSLSGNENYQRLEFLGDRVLGLAIATWLYEEFPGEAEGPLNRRFISLVRKETLAEIARELKLAERLNMTPGADKEGTREKEAVQSDVCEAIIGAMYLDGGFEAANAFIRKHWASRITVNSAKHKDHKTRLQEWAQAQGLALPSYTIAGRTGPDHSPVFTIEVSLEGTGSASAQGASKRIAEQAAAAALLEQIMKEG